MIDQHLAATPTLNTVKCNLFSSNSIFETMDSIFKVNQFCSAFFVDLIFLSVLILLFFSFEPDLFLKLEFFFKDTFFLEAFFVKLAFFSELRFLLVVVFFAVLVELSCFL